jgi:hypothetical protein
MQSVGSPDDLAPLDTSSHTSWTLDYGKMSHFDTNMVTMVDRWERSPHLGLCNPVLSQALMDDISLAFDSTTFIDMACFFSTLNVEHLMITSCTMMFYGLAFHWGIT